jgi:hypothetical protein
MKKIYILASLFLGITLNSYAQVITQWTFEGEVTTPSTGSGTASLIGATTATFAGGNGSTHAWNTTAYPAQSSGNGTAGVQFMVSTVGYSDIVVKYDARASATASRWLRLDYTTDNGDNWVPSQTNDGGLSPNNNFYSFNVDLTGCSACNNNAQFGFRIVSIFSPLAFNQNSTLSYGADEAYMRASADAKYTPDAGVGTSDYNGGTGTLRFDNVTVESVSTPQVSFAASTQSANEGAGSVNVTLNIAPAPAADETVTIRIDVANSTATYPADYTTTPAATANQFTVNIPSGATTATFAVNIVDDAITETNETIKFDINAVSAGLTIGSTASTVFTIIDNDIVQIPIKDVQFTTGGDLSDKEGEVVTIGGRVSAIKSGGGFFIQDNPGAWNGIYVFDGGVNTVVRGDSVIVTGTVVEFAPGGSTEKSTQITTLTSFINEGNYAPYAATPLSTNAINAEMYEGVLVSVANGSVSATMNGFGEYIINDGTGNAVIDDFLYLTTPAPALNEIYNVTGVIAHNFGAYKILPRDAADISKTLSVNENAANTFSIYPNPSNGLVNVNINGNVVVEVYNAVGKLVLSTTAKSFELPSGFYSVRVITENGAASKSLIVE